MGPGSLHQTDPHSHRGENGGEEKTGKKKKKEAYVSKITTGQIFSGTLAFIEKSLTV